MRYKPSSTAGLDELSRRWERRLVMALKGAGRSRRHAQEADRWSLEPYGSAYEKNAVVGIAIILPVALSGALIARERYRLGNLHWEICNWMGMPAVGGPFPAPPLSINRRRCR